MLGGSGYTRDFPVEQFYRDNRLNPIHEGTHGIHGLDLLSRKVRMQGGAALTALIERMRGTIDRLGDGADTDLAHALASRVARLEAVTELLWADGDAEAALANATTYLEAAGDLVIAWLLLDQVAALADRDDEFARAKRQTARFFVTHVLPRVDPQFALLESRDQTLAQLDESLI